MRSELVAPFGRHKARAQNFSLQFSNQRQLKPPTSHCRWLRQIRKLLQQRREHTSRVTVAAAEGSEASAAQAPLQERKSSWQTFWSVGVHTEGVSLQTMTEQRLTQA